MNNQDYDYILKFVICGDTSVGKSTILHSFINNTFIADCNPTMGVEFATKKINLGKKIIKIQIWDTVFLLLIIGRTRVFSYHHAGILQECYWHHLSLWCQWSQVHGFHLELAQRNLWQFQRKSTDSSSR